MAVGLVIATVLAFLQKFTAAGASVGAIVSVGGGVLAWTYQTGSARLGVVDLFACEIATLLQSRRGGRYGATLHRLGPYRLDDDQPTRHQQ
jgi:hypothetical protein